MTSSYYRRENAPEVVNSFPIDIYEIKQHWHKLLEERFAAFFRRA